ncbi:hypothetical protein BDA96_01G410700 [Sorghum bicolor]|uniref:Uncharacterized protein n=1 Tax=Sorghum bicolor TaxID=4558 RepID=A0A921V2X9_SORBI|nr:hypothetical protein BDA96_01G410700 [Sorghum bicolor]
MDGGLELGLRFPSPLLHFLWSRSTLLSVTTHDRCLVLQWRPSACLVGNICTVRPRRGALRNANSDPLKLAPSVVIQTYCA